MEDKEDAEGMKNMAVNGIIKEYTEVLENRKGWECNQKKLDVSM